MKNKSVFKNEFGKGNTHLDVRLTPDLRLMSGSHLPYKLIPSPLAVAHRTDGLSLFPSPLAGEGRVRGDKKGNDFTNTPSSVCPDFVRQTTSPARGEAKRLGFTLVELLVVVLIIGILAAVALPQYQKAVEKSRATQALALLKSLAQAQEVYKMANGQAALTFDELDVEVPWPAVTGTTNQRSNGEWLISLWHDSSQDAVTLARLTGQYAGAIFAFYSKINNVSEMSANKLYCMETLQDSAGNTPLFTASAGSYCQKMFHGNLVHTGAVRAYEVAW